MLLGISFDEIERIKQPNVQYYSHVYPLVDMRLTRRDCVEIIRDAGLPVPHKSACWFCPFADAGRFEAICARHHHVAQMASDLSDAITRARRERGLPELRVIPSSSLANESEECTGYCLV